MKFGVRQIANVVFRANANTRIGNKDFKKGQPVFYLDTAKTSSMESSATTVYATGGRGNTRLVTWEGEKTLTFNVEDALLSPISFAILSGAGVIKGQTAEEVVHFHQTTRVTATYDSSTGKSTINLSDALAAVETICSSAPIYVMKIDDLGDLTGEFTKNWTVSSDGKKLQYIGNDNSAYVVDYYVNKPSNKVTELQIDAGSFGGSYYVEADTLFRTQTDNKDYPANITFPNVKIQSNFTFSMAASGDPSTFSFVMDAMLGYTYFNHNRKVLCAIQIAEDTSDMQNSIESVFPHPAHVNKAEIIESQFDSVEGYTDSGDINYAENATKIQVKKVTITKVGNEDAFSGPIAVEYSYGDGNIISTRLTGTGTSGTANGTNGDYYIVDNSGSTDIQWDDDTNTIKVASAVNTNADVIFTIENRDNSELTTKFIVSVAYSAS